MLTAALALGLLIVAVGLYGLIATEHLAELLHRMRSRGGLALATGIRAVMAVVFWLAAPESRAPVFFQAMAVLAGVAALLLPLLGVDRVSRVIDWWLRHPPAVLRAWVMGAMAFGVAVAWAAWV